MFHILLKKIYFVQILISNLFFQVLVVFPSSESKTLSQIALSSSLVDNGSVEQDADLSEDETLNTNLLINNEDNSSINDSVEEGKDFAIQLENNPKTLSKTLKRQLSDFSDNSKNQNDDDGSPPSKKSQSKPPMSFNKVIFIDSTWNQCHTIINDERLKGKLFRTIKLVL